MFDRSEIVQNLIDQVYQLTESLGRGDTLTHDMIRQVLGVEPHEGKWDHVLNVVRRRLEETRGIATWSDYLVGYKLLSETEQLQLPAWRMQRASRQIRKAARSVKALPETGLSLNQRKLRATQITLLEDQQRSMRRDLVEQRALFALRQVSPRRPAQV